MYKKILSSPHTLIDVLEPSISSEPINPFLFLKLFLPEDTCSKIQQTCDDFLKYREKFSTIIDDYSQKHPESYGMPIEEFAKVVGKKAEYPPALHLTGNRFCVNKTIEAIEAYLKNKITQGTNYGILAIRPNPKTEKVTYLIATQPQIDKAKADYAAEQKKKTQKAWILYGVLGTVVTGVTFAIEKFLFDVANALNDTPIGFTNGTATTTYGDHTPLALIELHRQHIANTLFFLSTFATFKKLLDYYQQTDPTPQKSTSTEPYVVSEASTDNSLHFTGIPDIKALIEVNKNPALRPQEKHHNLLLQAFLQPLIITDAKPSPSQEQLSGVLSEGLDFAGTQLPLYPFMITHSDSRKQTHATKTDRATCIHLTGKQSTEDIQEVMQQYIAEKSEALLPGSTWESAAIHQLLTLLETQGSLTTDHLDHIIQACVFNTFEEINSVSLDCVNEVHAKLPHLFPTSPKATTKAHPPSQQEGTREKVETILTAAFVRPGNLEQLQNDLDTLIKTEEDKPFSRDFENKILHQTEFAFLRHLQNPSSPKPLGAILYGPPGTAKTTTIMQAEESFLQELSEHIDKEGIPDLVNYIETKDGKEKLGSMPREHYEKRCKDLLPKRDWEKTSYVGLLTFLYLGYLGLEIFRTKTYAYIAQTDVRVNAQTIILDEPAAPHSLATDITYQTSKFVGSYLLFIAKTLPISLGLPALLDRMLQTIGLKTATTPHLSELHPSKDYWNTPIPEDSLESFIVGYAGTIWTHNNIDLLSHEAGIRLFKAPETLPIVSTNSTETAKKFTPWAIPLFYDTFIEDHGIKTHIDLAKQLRNWETQHDLNLDITLYQQIYALLKATASDASHPNQLYFSRKVLRTLLDLKKSNGDPITYQEFEARWTSYPKDQAGNFLELEEA